MERKSDGICRRLIATSKTGCQIFAYVIPDLRAFAFIARSGALDRKPKFLNLLIKDLSDQRISKPNCRAPKHSQYLPMFLLDSRTERLTDGRRFLHQ